MTINDEMIERPHQLRLVKVVVRPRPGGRLHSVTALLDSGCNRTLLLERVAKALGLSVRGSKPTTLSGVHGSRLERMARVSFEVSGKDGKFYPIPNAATKSELSMPGPVVRWKEWTSQNPPFDQISEEIDDVSYKEISLYLGLDVEHLLLPLQGPSGWLESPDGAFRAYETKLGWTIQGPLSEVPESAFSNLQDVGEEEEWLAKLWLEFHNFNELEAIGVTIKTDKFAAAERREYSRMERLTRKTPDGRWEVPMLTRHFTTLPPSEAQARHRLKLLYRRLNRDERLKELYYKGIEQDEALGYIRKLSNQEAQVLREGPHWFLPHFPVFHPDKPDKCRRVLDAAAKNCGMSLNSFLHTGPNILNSLFGVLLRFRTGEVAINADVNAMFSQVCVPRDQQPLVAFLWNPDPSKEPDVYVNPRHIFGAACSPAVAIFALNKSAEDNPQLHQLVQSSFYMDDLFWSSFSTDEVVKTAKSVEKQLSTGGFVLSKWKSNRESVIRSWPLEERAKELKALGSDLSGRLPVVKALGVAWDCSRDTFTFESRKLDEQVTTVASVLSVLASIYDPLGIIAPFTLTGKQLFQELWMAHQSWKAQVPEEFIKAWAAWISEIHVIAEIHMPRWYGFPRGSKITLHIFADASTKGLGAVTYIKAENHQAMFVAAKTRIVPPSKRGNVPRLELQAALIAIRLARQVLEELGELSIIRALLWTDNQAVLRWLCNEDIRYDQYIANRVAEVQEITSKWSISSEIRFVETNRNPADLASRGVPDGAAKFQEKFDFWVHGPAFLDEPEDQWPKKLPPTKRSSEFLQQQLEEFALASFYRSVEPEDYDTDNLVEFLTKQVGTPNPTAEELDAKEREIIIEAQEEFFSSLIQSCKRSPTRTRISRQGDFRRRQTWLDPKGILRLQTRLFAAEDWPVEGALPACLPRRHPFTELVVRDAHRQVEHQGSFCTWSKIRERFYIPQGRTLVRKLCQDCPYCIKRRKTKMRQPLAGLHSSRLRYCKPPWVEVGMDHFGPFDLTGKQKRWGLIFICLTTRAVHIEDVDGLGMEPFCHALDRFINRRRRPEILRSDMGTTFVALAKIQNKTAEAYAEELRQGALKRFRIDLRFNPAGAPHWGGSWERLIREIKKILQSTLDSCGKWRKDDFRTFLTRAEGILNRRPIAFGDDGEVLAPVNFLQPSADVAVGPPLGAPSIASVELVKKMETQFWQKWLKYYLPAISAQRVLGKVRNDVLKPGDRVLVREGSNPLVDSWTPGTIQEVFPSADGVIRSVLVETEAGKLYRDVRRICILEGQVLQRMKGLPSPSGGGVRSDLQ